MKVLTKLAAVLSIATLGAGALLLSKTDNRVAKVEASSYSISLFGNDSVNRSIETDDNGNTSVKWLAVGGAVTVRLLRNSATVANEGEGLFEEITPLQGDSLKFHTGNMFEIKATSGYKLTNVTIYVKSWTSSYQAPRCGTFLVDDDGSYKVNGVTLPITGDKKPGEQLPSTYSGSGSSTYCYKFDASGDYAGGFEQVYIENIYSRTENPQNYGYEYYISSLLFTYKDDDATPLETPDTITLSAEGGATSVAFGETLKLSVLCTKGGSSEGVAQTVKYFLRSTPSGTYIQNHCDAGGVDKNGVFRPFANGTAYIRAKSIVDNNVNSEDYAITVTGGKTNVSAITFTAEDLGLGSYAPETDGYHTKDGFVVQISGLTLARDVTSKGKTKGAIKFETSSSFQVRSRVKISGSNRNIANVVLCMANGDNYRLTNSKIGYYSDQSLSNKTSSTGTGSTDFGNMRIYTLNGQLANISGIGDYINSITFEFVNGTYSAKSFADFTLGIQPDRSDMVNLCTGDTGYYRVLKDKLWSAGKILDGAKSEFQTSDDPTIAKARARYEAWASAYGDTTPYDNAISLATIAGVTAVTSEGANSSIIIICVSIFSIILIASLIAIMKKKQKR